MPQNIEQLKQFLAEEWEAVPQQHIVNINVKTRCELILENNGNRIPY